jgi:hypothetical protein
MRIVRVSTRGAGGSRSTADADLILLCPAVPSQPTYAKASVARHPTPRFRVAGHPKVYRRVASPTGFEPVLPP